MKPLAPNPIALATTLALLLSGAVAAQAPAAKPAAAAAPATQVELDAARAELARAARRVAELSHELGVAHAPRHVERRVVRKPVLGVLLAPDAQAGVQVAGITPDSGAAKAGLRSGDRIVSIDGKPILGSNGELRVDNARKLLDGLDTRTPVKVGYVRAGRNAVASVTPKLDQQVFAWTSTDGSSMTGNGNVQVFKHADGSTTVEAREFAIAPAPGTSPRIHREIIRLGPGGDCKGGDCKQPALAEAFRWHGLNLASVDPQLGRYFGTDRGVLVLSTGPELAGLQAGDVIRKVDGKPVATPREAMAAMHAKPAGSSVGVEYLRDRKPATAQVKVPQARPLRVPPMPPIAPKAPMAPLPPKGMQAPTPPAPPATTFEDAIEVISADGAMFAFLPDAATPVDAPALIEDVEIEVIEAEAR